MSELPAKPEQVIDPDQIASKLGPLLRPEHKKEGIRLVATMVQKYHSGPLPCPEDFAEYDRILPGSAERIFQLTEREQKHRHTQEERIITHEYRGRYVGQAGALVALLVGFGAVVYCATIGQPITAAVIGAVGAIVLGFLKYSAGKQERGEDPPKPAPKPKTKRRR